MTVPVQVRVRRPCEECGGTGAVPGPLWRAYLADNEQAERERTAMLAAVPGDRLVARVAVFQEWWARHGCSTVTSITDGAVQVIAPPEEVPCGECLDGWVERWVPLEELALVAA